MDDFEKKKNFAPEENVSIFKKKIFRNLEVLAKIPQNIFAYSFVSEHYKYSFFFMCSLYIA